MLPKILHIRNRSCSEAFNQQGSGRPSSVPTIIMMHSNEDAVMIPTALDWMVQHLSDASHLIMQHALSVISLKKMIVVGFIWE